MPVTTTKKRSVRQALNSGNPADQALGLQKVKVGNMMTPVKATIASLTAAAAVDITAAATKAAATVVGITLDTGENLPAIAAIRSLRVTASGTAASLGTYIVSDAGGTAIIPPGGASAAVGVALLSDDGKTLTFPNTVTGFVITYMPRADVSPDATDIQPIS